VTNEPDEKRIRTIARNLLTPEGKVNPHAIAALQSLGPDVIPIILHRFTGEETPEQEALLSVLEAFSEPAVAHHLMSVLPSTQSKAMARKIGGAIHTLGDVQCCERLAELAGDNNEAARLAAAIALRTCPADTSAATLVRQLNEDSSSECRIEALEGLAPASEAFANEAIRLTLQDKVPDVRLAAVKMITRRRAVNFQEDLKRLARSDSSPHVRKASSQALVELRLKTPASEEDAQ
jgi:HEAT repeat protein